MAKSNRLTQGDSKHRDHLANERTFLAWIRTSIGIMAFGFVVEKFTIFLRQIANYLGDKVPQHALFANVHGYSIIFGIFLVAFGTLISALAYFKYKSIEKQIDENVYYSSSILDLLLAACLVIMGILLVIYLINSV